MKSGIRWVPSTPLPSHSGAFPSNLCLKTPLCCCQLPKYCQELPSRQGADAQTGALRAFSPNQTRISSLQRVQGKRAWLPQAGRRGGFSYLLPLSCLPVKWARIRIPQIARAERAERRCTLLVANEASIMCLKQERMQKLQQLDEKLYELVIKLYECQEHKSRLQCQVEHLQQWLRGSRTGRGSQVGASSYLSNASSALPAMPACLMGPGHSSCCCCSCSGTALLGTGISAPRTPAAAFIHGLHSAVHTAHASHQKELVPLVGSCRVSAPSTQHFPSSPELVCLSRENCFSTSRQQEGIS